MRIVRQITIRQNSAVARSLVVFVICLVVGMFSYRVERIAWASDQIESLDSNRVSAAISTDEPDPRLHNQAGILDLDGGEFQPESAVREFRRAVDLNPRVADYWANLGQACFITSDLQCAKRAYEQSVAAAPLNPRFLNDLASFELATGDVQDALPRLHRLMEIDSASEESVLNNCLRTISPELLWKSVIRDQEKMSVRMRFLQILSVNGMGESAQRFWEDFAASRPTLSLKDVESYLSLLEGKSDYAKLIRVWQDLESLKATGMPTRAEGNLVVNANFQQTPSNLGMDWHIRSEQYVDAQITESSGGNALQLVFTVPHNAEHESAYQFIPVAPGKSYELRARARSEGITSDSGPRLRVVDPVCNECVNEKSDAITGSTDWRELSVRFTAAPTTQLVRVSVWRQRGRSFPTDIHGQFWLNSVSLRPLD